MRVHVALFSRDINWNFSVPAFREWYTSTHAHFIEDGMDFWWNDEGETAWFTVSHCTHRGRPTPGCQKLCDQKTAVSLPFSH